MNGMLVTETAVLLSLHPFGVFLFVFRGVVIPLFTICALESDSGSHDSTSIG